MARAGSGRRQAKPDQAFKSRPEQAATQAREPPQPMNTPLASTPVSQQVSKPSIRSGDESPNSLAGGPSEATQLATQLAASDGSPSPSGGSIVGSSPRQTGKAAGESALLEQGLPQRTPDSPGPEVAAGAEPSEVEGQPVSQQEVSEAATQHSGTSPSKDMSGSAQNKASSSQTVHEEKATSGITPERSRSQLLARQAAREDPLSVSPAKHAKTMQTEHETSKSRQEPEFTKAESSKDLAPSFGQLKLPELEGRSPPSEGQDGPGANEVSGAIASTSSPAADTDGAEARPVQDDEKTPIDSADAVSASISTALTGNAHSPKVKQDPDDVPAARLLASALSGNSMEPDSSEESRISPRTAPTNEEQSSTTALENASSEELSGSGGTKDKLSEGT